MERNRQPNEGRDRLQADEDHGESKGLKPQSQHTDWLRAYSFWTSQRNGRGTRLDR